MKFVEYLSEPIFPMIGRGFIFVFMTALVLVCPFLGCRDYCGTSTAHVACECHDCDHDHDGQPCHAPCDHNCPREGSNDCFCKGAILTDAPRCPDLDASWGFIAGLMADGSASVDLVALNVNEVTLYRGSHFPPLLSGRDICTLVGSHLL